MAVLVLCATAVTLAASGSCSHIDCTGCRYCCVSCFPVAMQALRGHHYAQSKEDLALFEQFFQGQTRGTFVEMGALDGIAWSNSLAYERVLGWNGVLIEPNPKLCGELKRNRPNATTFCTAVSRTELTLTFEAGRYRSTGRVVGDRLNSPSPSAPTDHASKHGPNSVQVPAAPLGALLRDAGVKWIDLFSLDVEGGELRVLDSMDWSVPVRVWTIEVLNTSLMSAPLASLMEAHGYKRERWNITSAGRELQMSHNQLWVWGGEWPTVRPHGKEPNGGPNRVLSSM